MTGAFIVYHDLNTDYRSKEYLCLAEKMCDSLCGVTKEVIRFDTKCSFLVLTKSRFRYLNFLRIAKKMIRKKKPDLIFLHDNYTASLISYIRKKTPNSKIIYDSSELYYDKKGTTIKSKIAYFLCQRKENTNIKRCNVIISACKERAFIMKDVYHLNGLPIVFDNIHRIDDDYDVVACEKKFSGVIDPNKINILYAGGVSEERNTFSLAESAMKKPRLYNLIICSGTRVLQKDLKRLESFSKFGNVFFVGKVSRGELKYLLSKCKISVSMFTQNCINNKYCASGKVFESIFALTPILVSTNPPLKRLCEEHSVGVSTDDIDKGFEELTINHEKYVEAEKAFIKLIDYDNRIDNLFQDVTRRLANNSTYEKK